MVSFTKCLGPVCGRIAGSTSSLSHAAKGSMLTRTRALPFPRGFLSTVLATPILSKCPANHHEKVRCCLLRKNCASFSLSRLPLRSPVSAAYRSNRRSSLCQHAAVGSRRTCIHACIFFFVCTRSFSLSPSGVERPCAVLIFFFSQVACVLVETGRT